MRNIATLLILLFIFSCKKEEVKKCQTCDLYEEVALASSNQFDSVNIIQHDISFCDGDKDFEKYINEINNSSPSIVQVDKNKYLIKYRYKCEYK